MRRQKGGEEKRGGGRKEGEERGGGSPQNVEWVLDRQLTRAPYKVLLRKPRKENFPVLSPPRHQS